MKVVINYQEYSDVEIEKKVLQQLPGVNIVESHTRKAEEFIPEVRLADGVIAQYGPLHAEVIAAMTCCKVISRYGIAVDTIDLAAAKAKGITVCNVPFYCLDEVSNHALALIFALHRKILTGDRLTRENQYKLQRIQPIPRLSDLAIGLVGFGSIPRVLANKIKHIFARIMVFDPFVHRDQLASHGVEAVELEQLFHESDFISIHATSNPKTRHMVNKKLLSLMKPSAYLINTSRGALIDEPALVDVLRERRIAGAGLDVFETEPLPPDSPLLQLDNVILTHHYAWYSEGAIRELKETAALEVLRVLSGKEPHHEVKV
jgi:D-3-phosphoglycerate dehydrogenase / 2-oxoglutarate reductase